MDCFPLNHNQRRYALGVRVNSLPATIGMSISKFYTNRDRILTTFTSLDRLNSGTETKNSRKNYSNVYTARR